VDYAAYFALAVAAAFYPLLITLVVLILPRRGSTRLLAALLLGGMSATIVSGIVIVELLGSTSAFNSDNAVTTSASVSIALGVVLLYAAAMLWLGRRVLPIRRRRKAPKDPAKKPWTTRMAERDSVGAALLLGIALNLPGVWYLKALAELIQGDLSTSANVLLILVYAVIVYVSVEIPLALKLVRPLQTDQIVDSSFAWVRAHKRELGTVVAGGVGVYLLIEGLTNIS
jgi:Sap, sulfolipid-1-addressing protein